MKRFLFTIGTSLFVLAACTFLPGQELRPQQQVPGDSFSSNGEKIYFTSITQDGEHIRYTEGPDFSRMMNPPLTCASCHGPTGEGGRHVMHMEVMDAPDIRFTALQGGEEEQENGDEHSEEENGHADEHADYALEDFRGAVIEGKHPDGEPLDENMPRWQMSNEALKDLFDFLKTLP